MNLIQIVDRLKGMPDDWLKQQAQNPSGAVPPYLVLGEIQRRETMRQAGTGQEPPAGTVYEDLLRQPRGGQPGGSGVQPQLGQPQQTGSAPGLGQFMAPPMPQRAMPAPPAGYGPGLQQGLGSMAMRMPPMRMAQGGLVTRMQAGGRVPEYEYNVTPTAPGRSPWTYDFPFMTPESGETFSTTATAFADREPEEESECPPNKTWSDLMGTCVTTGFDIEDKPVLGKYPVVPKPTWEEAAKEIEGKYPKLNVEPYERRLDQLRGQRDTWQDPHWSEIMTKGGFNLMASKSPFWSVAAGEAGAKTMQDWETRKDLMRDKRQDLEDKIAAADVARQQALDARDLDKFKASTETYNRLLVNYGIEQQMAGSRFSTESKNLLDLWEGMQKAKIEQAKVAQAGQAMLTDPKYSQTALDFEVDKARRIAEQTHWYEMDKILAREDYWNARMGARMGGAGLTPMNRLDAYADKLITEGFNKIIQDPATDVRGGDTTVILDRAARKVADDIDNGLYDKLIPDPRDREMIKTRVRGWLARQPSTRPGNFDPLLQAERDRRRREAQGTQPTAPTNPFGPTQTPPRAPGSSPRDGRVYQPPK